MVKEPTKPISGKLVETVSLSELCRTCGVRADWIVDLVEEGILEPEGEGPPGWRFSHVTMVRARTAYRLQRDLGVNLAGIAVALNLMDELDHLHRQLQRVGSLEEGQ